MSAQGRGSGGPRRVALISAVVAGIGGGFVALASCAGSQQSLAVKVAPKVPAASVESTAMPSATSLAATPVGSTSATTVAPATTAAPTTSTTVAVTTTTEPPTTTTTIAQAQPAPALAAPLEPLGAGARGDTVVALQQRLLDLGFWLEGADGQYGETTTQAVMAFQKYYTDFGLKTSGRADQATIDAISTVTLKPYSIEGATNAGDLMVVDKGRQLLHVVRAGQTVWTVNTSTGNGKSYTENDQKRGGAITGKAITPEGQFAVYREYTSGWEKGELGQLYRPKYFSGGIAVHGSNSIPNYPASHGCVRLTTKAMDWIWENDIMPRTSTVIVHG